MKFLIVDDSSTMRRIITNCLQRIGYTSTVEASDGAQALAKFDDSIGCIISDWNMPKMSGLELTAAVRAQPGGGRVPILMITTRASTDDIIAATKVGASGYILKPFELETFRLKLVELIGAVQAAA